VSYQDFSQSGYAGRNIVGVLPGQDPGNTRQYVIGAHYDSAGNPGADDNASGVAGMLEAAYVLSQHQFASTLVFVVFDLEEEGLWGSQAYVAAAQNNHDNIQGMVSMDMIAFNNPANPNTVEICRAYDNGAAFQNEVSQAFDDYTTLNLTVNPVNSPYSDHASFSANGYPAALVIDDLNGTYPSNPYYHTANDFYLNNGSPQQYAGLDYINLDYAADLTRGVVAWAADEGGLSNAPESGKTWPLLGLGWLAIAALRRLTAKETNRLSVCITL
jgi:leucyl aminopeptidase